MMFIIDVYRASQFIQSINPLADGKAVAHIRERWHLAGYRTKVRTVGTGYAPDCCGDPCAKLHLEGLHREPWYRG